MSRVIESGELEKVYRGGRGVFDLDFDVPEGESPFPRDVPQSHATICRRRAARRPARRTWGVAPLASGRSGSP
jgi:hypothetical protein